mgnify:CR=1 FL=1
MERKSAEAQFLKPNRNCNLTSWVPGCEPGWACSAGSNVKVDMKNSKYMPDRTHDSQPCCEGFFCPRGLTCMIRKWISQFMILDDSLKLFTLSAVNFYLFELNIQLECISRLTCS